ncbi:MAG: dihydroorotate dehydrogenase electron transfer subunit [Actinomycetota bacterium]|nr:dihydroorotate dehydrogenase electron transfer subunit [Actinomycetota bacterium]
MTVEAAAATPVQVGAEITDLRPAGTYLAVTLAAPEVASRALPGQFVALAVGGPETPMLLRRSFAIASTRAGALGIVFSVAGKGTAWLAERRAGDVVDVVGPLGRPFPLPDGPVAATLVGGGYGTAPLFPLADALVAAGSDVHFVVGAGTGDRLYGLAEAEARGPLAVTTDDGSAGVRGRVSDVLPDVLARSGSRVVYACGPMGMLRAVTEVAAGRALPAYVAVEESMACGIGVCMTCVLPVVGDDGRTRMLRSCVEGPVFAGERVRFDAVGTVPPDAVGAPVVRGSAGGGH